MLLPLHQELCSCQTVILSVEDEVGQRIIIEDLLEATRGTDPGLRQAAVTILNAYFARTRLDYSAHTRTLLSGVIRLLNDSNPEVLSQSWDTINSITKVCSYKNFFTICMSFHSLVQNMLVNKTVDLLIVFKSKVK